LLASFLLTRLLRTLLFGVSVTDPLTFVAITLLLTLGCVVGLLYPGPPRNEGRSIGGT
jgi:hypothetical protein